LGSRFAPAVFLDRDGVLADAIVVEGKPYPPRSLEALKIAEEVVASCRLLRETGFKLICVTNQPDVARGRQSQAELDRINEAVVARLGLDALRVCPHSDEDRCRCRKPKPGMLTDAATEFGVDLSESYMVGDRWRDIDAGVAAGCRSVFIDRGYSERQPKAMVHSCASLAEAARFILSDRLARQRARQSGGQA
jgi:D-glycero-D-manno-heptose 1,7-bisphosphate phosphatase